MKINLTVYQLIENPLFARENPRFFSRNNLRFAGERLSEVRVFRDTAEIADNLDGALHECIVVSTLQRNAPGGARRHYAYFDMATMEQVFPKGK